ncbi:MAG TPA: DUF1573 domain-containing protein [Isosphaeraceae bacterium]|jgi:hypothetical protein
MRRASALLAAWVLLAAGVAPAQDWVATVFPERSKDLGTVARGSKVRHAFRIVNTTNQDIRILNWRTKCGCTEVRVGAREIPPGTQTVVEAVLDTTKFQGYKASGLTLVLERPQFLEVDLDLTCFIRGDVMLSPGSIDFGVVGRAGKPTLALNLSYAGGQPDWQVTKMQTVTSALTATLQELGRSEGAVQYQIVATLDPAAAPGYFKDELTLLTNDPASPRIPISVAAVVQAGVTLSPSIINLGHVRPGATIQKTVLMRAAQPFQVTAVKPTRGDIQATRPPAAARPIQALTVAVKVPDRPGPYNAVLEVTTDLKDEPPVSLTTFATVDP